MGHVGAVVFIEFRKLASTPPRLLFRIKLDKVHSHAHKSPLQHHLHPEGPYTLLLLELDPQNHNGDGLLGPTVEARKLEHSCPHTLNVKYKGS